MDKLDTDYEGFDETEIDEADAETETDDEVPSSKTTGKKRGRKSAKDKALTDEQKESEAINSLEFKTREELTLDAQPFSISCGKCIFYSRQATYGVPCDMRGIVASDVPCSRFQYNVKRVAKVNVSNLVSALQEIGSSGITISELAALMVNSRPIVLKGMGFHLSQKVWFSTTPHAESQTADMWHHAVVIGEKNGKILVVMENGAQPALSPSMLLSEDEFSKVEMRVPAKKREVIEKIYALRTKSVDDNLPIFDNDDEDEGDEKPAKATPANRLKMPKRAAPLNVIKPLRVKKKAVRLRG